MNIPELVTRKFLRSKDQLITAALYEIVIARNGVFKRAKRREMTASLELSAFNIKIPELAEGAAQVELVNKIPAPVFEEILVHARNSTDISNFTENLYAVYWNEPQKQYLWQEISQSRSYGSTIADEENPAYGQAILEIHTHPKGCRRFSSQDDRDESGKFRLFGILVDIHSEKPSIRLRVGIYDSFWEIPVEFVSDIPLENFTDLVKEEQEQLKEMLQMLETKSETYIYTEDFTSVHELHIENL